MRSPVEQRIYNSHRFMKQVIYNPNSPNHQSWIQHGIPLEEDIGNFQTFYKWVMTRLGPPPFDRARIVRKDQTRGYLRSNLEWNTHKAQGDRLRSTIKIKYRGKTRCLKQWGEELGISYHVLYGRHQRGTLDFKKVVKEYCGS